MDVVCCIKKLSGSLIRGIRVEEVCVMKCFVDVERTLRKAHMWVVKQEISEII